jgi:hypothetical protein
VRFYQQVYALPPTDRPGDDVIKDDAALDKWYEAWQRQLAAEASKLKAQQNGATVGAPAPMDAVRSFGG